MDEIMISSYRSPLGRDSIGRAIPAGQQDVELITGGRGFFELEGQVLESTAGCMLWHLPGEWTIYRSDPEEPYECLVLSFPFAAGDRRPAPRFSRWASVSACMDFAGEIAKHFHGAHPNLPLLALYAFNVLRWQAMRWERGRGGADLPPPLEKAMDLIESRFAEPISVDDLAAVSGLSTAHLHALFRESFGTTPHRRIVDLRLAEARRLLATTRRSIKDIGTSVGYPDAVTFCKLFKSRCGCRPLEYRERHMQKDGELSLGTKS